MKLRGIDFGCVLDASGTEGFFGEGYPYQKALRVNFSGATFVAKTVTSRPRAGNMRMRRDGSLPWWPLRPDCIVVKLRKGVALNAVGLSNPGAESLLSQGKWQKRKDPFFLSFMAISATKEERMKAQYYTGTEFMKEKYKIEASAFLTKTVAQYIEKIKKLMEKK